MSTPRVFAVEDTVIQLEWPAVPPGEHTVAVGGRTVVVRGDGGPAAFTVDGLPAGAVLDLAVDGQPVGTVHTLDPPPGEELCRFATVSDLHMGDGWTFGILPTLTDTGGPADPPVLRCARAAVAELADWGAQHLVAKGDLTHRGEAHEWQLAAQVLAGAGLPAVATIGNHDVCRGAVDGRPALAGAGIELVVGGIAVRDLPGVRIIVADATMPERHPGSFHRVGDAILDAARDAAGGVVLAMHHQLQRAPLPTHWPPGVLGPHSGRFLRALARANPNTLVTSGHTHRHRARRVGSVVLTEVGSPKDHPGTWAGYVVHEGGIRQVVRRVAAPAAIRWTEDTGRALFGMWGRWSPGRLQDRCFSHPWTI